MTLTEVATLLEKNTPSMRKDGSQNTKIVATVGPACNTYEKLLELVKAGVDVFRLNFSHSNHAAHLEVIGHIQANPQRHPQLSGALHLLLNHPARLFHFRLRRF